MPLRRDTTTNNNAFGKMVCNLKSSKEFDTTGGDYVQTRESVEREVQREPFPHRRFAETRVIAGTEAKHSCHKKPGSQFVMIFNLWMQILLF